MKHCKFTPAFRSSADEVAIALGLRPLHRPTRDGVLTMRYHDPLTGAEYSISESGYVRRWITGPFWGGVATRGYQLNAQRRGAYWNQHAISRILHSPHEQLGRMAAAVLRYRKNHA